MIHTSSILKISPVLVLNVTGFFCRQIFMFDTAVVGRPVQRVELFLCPPCVCRISCYTVPPASLVSIRLRAALLTALAIWNNLPAFLGFIDALGVESSC